MFSPALFRRIIRLLTFFFFGIVSLIPLAIWNVVETNVGVLLACLPSMRPLLKVLLGQKLDTRLSKKSTKESSRELLRDSKG